jgi:hypothetical protein
LFYSSAIYSCDTGQRIFSWPTPGLAGGKAIARTNDLVLFSSHIDVVSYFISNWTVSDMTEYYVITDIYPVAVPDQKTYIYIPILNFIQVVNGTGHSSAITGLHSQPFLTMGLVNSSHLACVFGFDRAVFQHFEYFALH